MKISVIGSGNVGATCANVLALKNFATEVVMVDIRPGFTEGKAMDMMQTAQMMHIDTKIIGVTAPVDDAAKADGAVPTLSVLTPKSLKALWTRL